MSYQALYRAWRPKTFSDVVGQKSIVSTLTRQVLSGRVTHAYLFCGSRGTGKTSAAKVLARAVNCLKPTDAGDPCEICEVCRTLSMENNMDIMEIDAASNNGVDEVRELRDKIKYPPSIGRYKVYIIDEAHMLSAGAFNALLKTLEEPPAHAMFILATTEPQKLPATILSRCQRYDFKRIAAPVIVERLSDVLDGLGRSAEAAALDEIARASEGGMRDALSLLDMCLSYGAGKITAELVRDVLGASDRGTLFQFVQALLEEDAGAALRLIDEQMQSGRDAQVFARETAMHIRALMVAQFAGDGLCDLLEVTAEDAERFRAQAQGRPVEKLMRLMDLFMRTEGEMRWASTPRAALELCAVRACHPEREAGDDALAERVARLEMMLARGETAGVPGAGKSAAYPAEENRAGDADLGEKREAEGDEKINETADETGSASGKLGDGEEVWKEAVTLIRKWDSALYPPVSHLNFLGIEGNIASLSMPKKWNMHLGVLQKDAKREMLEKALAETAGRPIQIRLKEEAEQDARKLSSSRQTLNQVYDWFGRENVSVLDEERL